jgi:hypothetical protein
LCLIARRQVICRDDLAATFGKRIAKFHAKAREELERIRSAERHTTEHVVATFTELLTGLHRDPDLDDAACGRLVRRVLAPRGGVDGLLADCEAISAYHGDNYPAADPPLLRPATQRAVRLRPHAHLHPDQRRPVSAGRGGGAAGQRVAQGPVAHR